MKIKRFKDLSELIRMCPGGWCNCVYQECNSALLDGWITKDEYDDLMRMLNDKRTSSPFPCCNTLSV